MDKYFKYCFCITLLFCSTLYAQEQIDYSNFLKVSMEKYNSASSIQINVSVNLLEKDNNTKQSFECITKKKGNQSYLLIRQTELITTDSLRLFVDHNSQYIQLQKIVDTDSVLNPVAFIETIDENIKRFIDLSETNTTEEHIVFSLDETENNATNIYYFNKNTHLLDKAITIYTDSNNPYDSITMLYDTNLNEEDGNITIDLNDFIEIKNSEVFLNKRYESYEFINQL
ncbi:MAG: hypothetical protein GYB35_14040 [Algicola sp.]|nr:hypothetical protein [Algicola sp.]